MSSDAPGPAPDRAVLARAEADWRATPPDLAGWVALSRDASQVLMAEYDRRGAELDRQRARIAAVLAVLRELVELQAPESDLPMPLSEWQTRWENAWTDARRALNEGEGR